MSSGNVQCLKTNLQLAPMLLGGQSFRWIRKSDENFVGVFNNAVWEIFQNETHLQFSTHRKINQNEDNESILKSYLRLDTDIKPLYKTWALKDSHFKKSAENFFAIRMLRQELIENLFSFICSSNNNIKRITSMVENLCKMFGDPIVTINGMEYFSFPKVSALTKSDVEEKLKQAGFGYRAKFIYQTACKIADVGEDAWVKTIKQLNYPDAKKQLMLLPGIGPKVADCICLMALDHLEAIPVDTHVFQIAANHYLTHLKDKKSVTDRIYKEIGDHFRDLYGPYAGWAHTILFCNDLKAFQEPDGKRKIASNGKSKRVKKT